MITTTVFARNLNAWNNHVRRVVNKGGTRSGKTYALLQLLLHIAQTSKNVSISVVSESLPHLRLGAIRDFENILKDDGLYNELAIDFTNHIYYFGSSFIEFFAADQTKATGPTRNILFLNEVNNIPLPVVRELTQRTDETIFYDFNPTAEFWIVDEVFSLPDDQYTIITSNYLDNEQLKPAIKQEIEQRAQRDPNFKRVHIDVEWGSYEGLIFPEWKMVDAMPETSERCYGMDFGFTNDPSTLIDVRFHAGEIWMDELLYEKGCTPERLDQVLKLNVKGRKETIADSSDPRMIDYLQRKSHNILPAVKGPDSVTLGIELMKQYPVNVTKRSVNLIKERRNYRYAAKNGNTFNEPAVGQADHAIDGARYGVMRLITPKKKTSHRVVSPMD